MPMPVVPSFGTYRLRADVLINLQINFVLCQKVFEKVRKVVRHSAPLVQRVPRRPRPS